VEDVGAFESKESHGDFFKLGESLNLGAGEPLLGIEAPSVSELTHLNERILQLQKKELDKSPDTPTEDDGY